MTSSTSEYGLLKVFVASGDKCTKVPLSCTTFTIGSDTTAAIRVFRNGVEPIHCSVRVQSNGLALLENKSISNPVPINDKAVPKQMYLMPNDTFSVVGKQFLYENTALSPEILQQARKKNLENYTKMMRRTITQGRTLLTPQPEKKKMLKPRRSASMDNITTESAEEMAKSPLAGDGHFRVESTSPMSPHPTKSTRLRVFNGFTVSTPRSAIKPSLRNSKIFQNLTTMDFPEPECEPSPSGACNREAILKTPIADVINLDAEEMSTPLSNTSVITIESPLKKDTTPLRSRKSKAKDVSIQRLTQNDDSVVVLDTPDSKTPKSALKGPSSMTPISSVNQTKLTDEYSDDDIASVNKDDIESALKPSLARTFERSEDIASKFDVSSVLVMETDSEDVDDINSPSETVEGSESDSPIGMKRKRESSTTEEFCSKRMKPSDIEESVAEMNSFSSDVFTTDNEGESSNLEEATWRSPPVNLHNTRKALTEPRQTKKTFTRRSLSDRISNQENEPVLESSNSTLETVDTSSFLYVKNNITFENSDFGSPTPTQKEEGSGKKTQERLNDLSDVAGFKKLLQTPIVQKEPLNDLTSVTGIKRLMKTPKTAIAEGEHEESVTSVFDMSGMSPLCDDGDDIFPVRRAHRTYGKSMPAKSGTQSETRARKSEGCALEVSPEVDKWVEETTEHQEEKNDTLENLDNNECLDDSFDLIPPTPDKATPMRKSVRIAIDALQFETATRGFKVKSRGCSLPATKEAEATHKVRRTEGVTNIDVHDDEWLKGDETDEDNVALEEENEATVYEGIYEEPTIAARNSTRNKKGRSLPAATATKDKKRTRKTEGMFPLDVEDQELPENDQTNESNINAEEEIEEEEEEENEINENSVIEEPLVLAGNCTRKSTNGNDEDDAQVNEDNFETEEDVQDEEDNDTIDESLLIEEPVIAARKSTRKSMNALEEDDVCAASNVDQTNEENSEPEEEVQEEELIDTIVNSLIKEPATRKSTRKSIKLAEDKVCETSQSGDENVETEEEAHNETIESLIEEPVATARKSSRKFIKKKADNVIVSRNRGRSLPVATESKRNKKTRKTEGANLADVQEWSKDEQTNDENVEVVEEEHDETIDESIISTRKSTRKSMNNAGDDVSEKSRLDQTNEDIVESEEEVQEEEQTEAIDKSLVEESMIAGRKSSRKSMKKTEDNFKNTRHSLPAPKESKRYKSTRKTEGMVSADVEVHSEEREQSDDINETVEEVCKSATDVDTEDEDFSLVAPSNDVSSTSDESEELVADATSRRGTRKTLNKTEIELAETIDKMEKILPFPKTILEMEIEDISEPEVEERKNIPRKSIRKSRAGVDFTENKDSLSTNVLDELTVTTRKSSRKSMSKTEYEDEDRNSSETEMPVSSRKSGRKLLDNENESVEKTIAESIIASGSKPRKSFKSRSSSIHNISDSELPPTTPTSKPHKNDSLMEKTPKHGNKVTPVTPVSAADKKDEDVFKTPKLLSKTPARSTKKSAKPSNTLEVQMVSVIEEKECESKMENPEEINNENNVEQVRKSKRGRIPKKHKDDLSPIGLKRLLATPKVANEPKNDLSSPKGLKKLLATPRVTKEPKNDLSNPKGLKKLLATPKVGKEPTNDLSSPKGLKSMFATPREQKEPKNDLTSPRGVKQLLATPKVMKSPENDLSNPKGLKKLLATPRGQKKPKNDLTDIEGVEELFETSQVEKVETSTSKKRSARSTTNTQVHEAVDAILEVLTPQVEVELKEEALSQRKSSRTRRNAENVDAKIKETVDVEETPKPPATKKTARTRRAESVTKEEIVKPASEVEPEKVKKGVRPRRKNVTKAEEIVPAVETPKSEEVIAETEKPTRTRGRKPTNKALETIENLPSATKVKRGRGAKTVETESNEIIPEEQTIEEEPIRKQTRSRRGHQAVDTNEVEEKAEVPAKRSRRGAKKEEPNEEVTEKPVEVEEEPAKKTTKVRRGKQEDVEEVKSEPKTKTTRAKKSKKDEKVAEEAETKEGEETAPPAEPAEVTTEEVSEEKIKKRGGRRKKEATPEVTEEDKPAEPAKKQPAEPAKKQPAKRGGRRKVVEPAEESLPEAAKVEPDTSSPEVAPAKTTKRSGRKTKAKSSEETAITEEETDKKAVKRPRRGQVEVEEVNEPVKKRGRAMKNAKPEPVDKEEKVVQEIVKKTTRQVKGVTTTTISVRKKVGFKIEEKNEILIALTTPERRTTKRRLKSEEEMNGSYEQYLPVQTRSRK